jgi:hypothetical protein
MFASCKHFYLFISWHAQDFNTDLVINIAVLPASGKPVVKVLKQ